ncbi:MAG: AAA family ATPase [Neisseria sp.]|nr:AAA family ATPase [Neisseria sp.]
MSKLSALFISFNKERLMSSYRLNPCRLSLYAEQYILKGMLELGYFGDFFSRGHYYRDDDLAELLGIPCEMEKEKADLPALLRPLLRERWQAIQQQTFTPNNLTLEIGYQNIAFLADKIGLNDVEKHILCLAFHLRLENGLSTWFENLPNMQINDVCQLIAQLCQLPVSGVQAAIAKSGKLMIYGLIQRDRRADNVSEFLYWGSAIAFSDFISSTISSEQLLARCLLPTEPSKTTWQQFDYVHEMRQKIKTYLQVALNKQEKGVNVLIYGKPGTGKTELAKLIIDELACASYTLTYQDSDGETLEAKARLEKCQLAQHLLADSQSVLIFDEVEDVFAGSIFERSAAQEHKAWTNHLLESNAVPIIWISNDVSMMDNAFLRRFGLIFEMPDLPAANKAQFIREQVGDLLPEHYVQHFAQVAALTPALLSQGLKVAKSLHEAQADWNFAQQSLAMFNETLKAQGFAKILAPNEQQLAYNLDFVACDSDIHKIADGIKRHKRGRICCYGPAGTGKSEWARWLAQELAMPILVKRGSDLLDKYVGSTERNIAAAFEEARDGQKVLVFDEVDSFLFARKTGQKTWEHSCVNEMLTQIERFDGLLIVSTNLMQQLDPAALRRFDIKLYFDYLRLEQRQQVAIEQVAKLGLPPLNASEQAQLKQLNVLTLGDFVAVARRHRFAPFEQTAEWLNALAQECALKNEHQPKSIGFFH